MSDDEIKATPLIPTDPTMLMMSNVEFQMQLSLSYARGKAEAEKRINDQLMLRSDIPPIYTEKVRRIIFGGGDEPKAED